jgi:signal transduction histidine kinase/DNA-binding response OmpR family regulator
MGRFQDYSIKRKLITITLSMSSAALLLACAAFITYDQFTVRETIKKTLRNQVKVFGASTRVFLEFPDERSGDNCRKYLKYLNDYEGIVAACIYTSPDDTFAAVDTGAQESSLLARYPEDSAPGGAIPDNPGPGGITFENGFFEIFAPIRSEEGSETVGVLFIRYDGVELGQRFQDFCTVVAIVLLAAFILVLVLSTRFQRVISEPILSLASTAGIVSENQDYSLRVAKHSNDEIGLLITRFNEMLAQIEKRDRELKTLNDQLAESEKRALAATETKSQFLASMSHELRTPLNAIIGYSELLQEEAEDAGQSDALPDLERIHSAGKHLLGLINDILDLSKVEAGKMTLYFESFDLKRLVDSVSSTIRPLIANNSNQFELVCPDHIGSMHSDQTKVRQCLLNLLSNACKFTEKGTIRLEIGVVTVDDTEFVEFRVADSGIGMTPEQLGRLFKAFSQASASTSTKYGGTGLGLALSQKFSHMLGGDLTVTSEQGKGSVFTLRIPRHHGEAALESDGPEPGQDEGARSGATRILAIDDDPAVRDLVQRSLAKHGYHVKTCAEGEEGLRLARTFKPDIVVLDVVLPGIDGWSVLTELKEDPEFAKIPVVMVSFVQDPSKGFSLGAADYITKPIDWKRLTDVLEGFRSKRGPIHVLVVEDDKITRELLESVVQGAGFQVARAENGRDALEAMKVQTPDLILLDLMMPVMNGFEFMKLLRESPLNREIPVIVLTSKDVTPEERRTLEGGGSKIMSKGSYGMQELLEEIRRVHPFRPGGDSV